MTNREQHARDVLQAAANSRHVDTETLWHGVQSQVDQQTRRSGRNPIVLLAAGAAAALAGFVIWAGGFGWQPTPPTSTQGLTATVTPGPSETPTTAPTPRNSTTTVSPSLPVKPMVSTAKLLTADDYRAARIPMASVQATGGWGQAPISACQDIPGEGASTAVVRGEGQRSTEPGQVPAEQYVLGLGTTDAAEQLVERILHWPDGCASLGRGGVDEGVITSSPPQSVSLPAGKEGHFYVITFEQGGSTRAERVSVARSGNIVSVVVLHEVGDWQRHFAGDEAELVRRTVARLG